MPWRGRCPTGRSPRYSTAPARPPVTATAGHGGVSVPFAVNMTLLSTVTASAPNAERQRLAKRPRRLPSVSRPSAASSPRARFRRNNIAKAHPGSFGKPTSSEKRYAAKPIYVAHGARRQTNASKISPIYQQHDEMSSMKRHHQPAQRQRRLRPTFRGDQSRHHQGKRVAEMARAECRVEVGVVTTTASASFAAVAM